MNAKYDTRPGVLSAILLLFTAYPLLAQITPTQRLTDALALQMEGKPAPAIVELRALLNSNSLDTLGSGKAWNILGLADEDMGEFALSQRAYEESLRILQDLPDNTRDYAMALDDFGGLYVATGQFEIADKMRTKALGLYEKIEDHGGVARASCDLATVALSQKKVAAGRKYLTLAVKEARAASDLDDDDRNHYFAAGLAGATGWRLNSERDKIPAGARSVEGTSR